MHDTSPPAPAREITGTRLLTFNMISVGGLLVASFYYGYSFYYYTYVIGLDALLTSIGSAIAVLTAGIGAPIFGILSDNRPVKNSTKRKSFFIRGLPFLVVSGILVWLPPEKCQPGETMNWIVASYFWLFSFLLFVSWTAMSAAYYGMIPEQATTEANRITVSKVQGLFNLSANAVSLIIPIFLQAVLPDPQHPAWYEPSGQVLTASVPVIAVIFAAMCGCFTMVSYLTIDEGFLESPAGKRPVVASLKRLFTPLENRNARFYFGYSLTTQGGAKILITLAIPFLTFVLAFQGLFFIIYLAIVLVLNFVGLSIWNAYVKRKGVISANQLATALMVVTLISIPMVFLPVPKEVILPIVLSICLVALFCLNAGYLTGVPIVSAIVDEASEMNQKKEAVSGLFFGLNGFFTNIGVMTASLFMGLYFTGGQEENPVLIAVAYPITAVFFAIALVLNKKLVLPALRK